MVTCRGLVKEGAIGGGGGIGILPDLLSCEDFLEMKMSVLSVTEWNVLPAAALLS